MVFVVAVLFGIYFYGAYEYYKHNQLTLDLISDLAKQNDLLSEQNYLLRGIIKKYGLDI